MAACTLCLGIGTYTWYVADDHKRLVCTSEEKVKDVCKKCFIAYGLYTRSGNVIHLSLENKTKEDTEKSQSKIIIVALFCSLTRFSSREREQFHTTQH